jgi:eukaryotic-like serine/threonine-protein kinase
MASRSDDPNTDEYASTQRGHDASTNRVLGGEDLPLVLPPARYRYGEVIGKGGMGEVIAAEDERIGREVALKRMRTESTGEALTRFLREARIQARLDHPSIVPVYALDIDAEGRPYFTMKRVTGRTLAHRLADGGSQNRMLRAFADVCNAIEFAHSRGVIHRDLKPSNIMLGDYGEVYVLDWGVARVTSDPDDPVVSPFATYDITTLDETKTGAMLGTPGYMAPEQLRGLTPTPAADIYALGAILFEILADEPLHPRGESAVGSTLARPQAAPSLRNERVAPELDALCLAALSEEPTARPNAHELAEAVQHYLDGDRDLERRRQLAAEQLASAREALVSDAADARATAMRKAGRALALDPESRDAAALVSSLLLEPPSPMPAELVASIEDHERKIAQHRSWRAIWAYGSIFALAPLLLFLDVRNWTLVGAFFGTVAICMLVALDAARDGRPSVLSILVCNLALALMFTRVLGPFVLTPLAICCMLVGIAAIRRINAHRWLVIGWTATAVLLPILLEWVDVLPDTWSTKGGAATMVSSMFRSVGDSGESLSLVAANLVFTLVVAAVALAFAVKRQDAQRQLYVREWHLRQLIPADGQRVTSR